MRKKQKMMKEEGFFSNFVFINERERRRLERESSVHEQASHADLFSSFIPRSKRTTRMTSVKHITVVTVTSAAPVNSTSHVKEVKKNPKRVCSDNGEEKGSSKKRMKKNEKPTTCVLPEDPAPAPPLPANFRAKIEGLNGSEIVLVFQKKLFDSDVSKGQGRLLLPHKQIKAHGFLTPEERDGLNKIGGKIQHKEVLLIDPSCRNEWVVSLKIWEMGKSNDDGVIRVNYMYSLGKNWYKIVQSNGLKKGMIVQLWAFRVESNLRFALVKVETLLEENDAPLD